MDAVATRAVNTAGNWGTPFKSGAEWNGNRNGRPKGAKSKLSEIFLEDLLDVWKVGGRAALERALEDEPAKIIAVIAHLIPKDFEEEKGGGLTIKIVKYADRDQPTEIEATNEGQE
jgi:hypothetical protein